MRAATLTPPPLSICSACAHSEAFQAAKNAVAAADVTAAQVYELFGSDDDDDGDDNADEVLRHCATAALLRCCAAALLRCCAAALLRCCTT